MLTFNPACTYYSIIGNRKEGGVVGGTDGIVPYWSSHLDGAASELVVHATHTEATKQALAVRDVRRILLEHARELKSTPASAPVAAP